MASGYDANKFSTEYNNRHSLGRNETVGTGNPIQPGQQYVLPGDAGYWSDPGRDIAPLIAGIQSKTACCDSSDDECEAEKTPRPPRGMFSKAICKRPRVECPRVIPQSLQVISSQEKMPPTLDTRWPGNRNVHRFLLQSGAEGVVPNAMSAIANADPNLAAPLESNKIMAEISEQDDPWQTRDKFEDKVPFDTITNALGETVTCFQEARPPPPTTTKGAIYFPERLALPNPKLMAAQGYDVHAPIRHKKEQYKPRPIREKTEKEMYNEIREELQYRTNAELMLNQNGNLPFQQLSEGKPITYDTTYQAAIQHMKQTLPPTTRDEEETPYVGQPHAELFAGTPGAQNVRRDLQLNSLYTRNPNPIANYEFQTSELAKPSVLQGGLFVSQPTTSQNQLKKTQRTTTSMAGPYYGSAHSQVMTQMPTQGSQQRDTAPLLPEYVGQERRAIGAEWQYGQQQSLQSTAQQVTGNRGSDATIDTVTMLGAHVDQMAASMQSTAHQVTGNRGVDATIDTATMSGTQTYQWTQPMQSTAEQIASQRGSDTTIDTISMLGAHVDQMAGPVQSTAQQLTSNRGYDATVDTVTMVGMNPNQTMYTASMQSTGDQRPTFRGDGQTDTQTLGLGASQVNASASSMTSQQSLRTTLRGEDDKNANYSTHQTGLAGGFQSLPQSAVMSTANDVGLHTDRGQNAQQPGTFINIGVADPSQQNFAQSAVSYGGTRSDTNRNEQGYYMPNASVHTQSTQQPMLTDQMRNTGHTGLTEYYGKYLPNGQQTMMPTASLSVTGPNTLRVTDREWEQTGAVQNTTLANAQPSTFSTNIRYTGQNGNVENLQYMQSMNNPSIVNAPIYTDQMRNTGNMGLQAQENVYQFNQTSFTDPTAQVSAPRVTTNVRQTAQQRGANATAPGTVTGNNDFTQSGWVAPVQGMASDQQRNTSQRQLVSNTYWNGVYFDQNGQPIQTLQQRQTGQRHQQQPSDITQGGVTGYDSTLLSAGAVQSLSTQGVNSDRGYELADATTITGGPEVNAQLTSAVQSTGTSRMPGHRGADINDQVTLQPTEMNAMWQQSASMMNTGMERQPVMGDAKTVDQTMAMNVGYTSSHAPSMQGKLDHLDAQRNVGETWQQSTVAPVVTNVLYGEGMAARQSGVETALVRDTQKDFGERMDAIYNNQQYLQYASRVQGVTSMPMTNTDQNEINYSGYQTTLGSGANLVGANYDRASYEGHVILKDQRGPPQRAGYADEVSYYNIGTGEPTPYTEQGRVYSQETDSIPQTQRNLTDPSRQFYVGPMTPRPNNVAPRQVHTVGTRTDNRGYRDVADYRPKQKVRDNTADNSCTAANITSWEEETRRANQGTPKMADPYRGWYVSHRDDMRPSDYHSGRAKRNNPHVDPRTVRNIPPSPVMSFGGGVRGKNSPNMCFDDE